MYIENKSSEDRAYSEIMSMILSRELPPGSPVMEAAIAEKLSMSRTPIRSAIRRLASSGLVEMTVNKSPCVPILTKKDWDDLFDLRLKVEPAIAALAAERYCEGAGEQMRDLLSAEKNEDTELSAQDLNEMLHFKIAEVADNKYMYRSLQQVFWRCQLYICFFDSFLSQKEERILNRFEKPLERKSIVQHEDVVNAILDKKPQVAEQVMREHILSTYERASTFKI